MALQNWFNRSEPQPRCPRAARPHGGTRSVATGRAGLRRRGGAPPGALGQRRRRWNACDPRGASSQRVGDSWCPPRLVSPAYTLSGNWRSVSGCRADAARHRRSHRPSLHRPDHRPWLRHAGWPPGYRPLIDPPRSARTSLDAIADDYPFVRVEGDGVHEIAVGPVHAGIIEPGHFRFSVVGEKVLRLEERLGYVHKGIEQRFAQLPILEAHRLAARVSGDSAVAFSWAYCQALEGLAGNEIPPRAAWLRALYLELERVANHLGDLGALGERRGIRLWPRAVLASERGAAAGDARGAR